MKLTIAVPKFLVLTVAANTATVVVNVQAVTVGIDLKISDGNSFVNYKQCSTCGQTIAEDTALNLINLF